MDKIEEEVGNLEHLMEIMEGDHKSYAFSGSEMLEKQLLINQSLLKIIKQLAEYSKEKDWV